MSRTANKPKAPTPAAEVLPALDRKHQANQVDGAIALQEKGKRVSDMALQLNYNGSTDPDVLENSARDAIRRIGAGIFELGSYLLLLKDACEHGKFLPTLERLNIGRDAAKRYMAVTRRFANGAAPRHLEAIGMSKLVELLPLDDEQIEDLTGLGETGELALDKVASMSLRELRARVRDLEVKAERKDKELQRLQGVNEELHDEARRIKRQKPDQARAGLMKEASDITLEVLGRTRGELRHALGALGQLPEPPLDVMAGMVGQVQRVLLELRDEFNLPDVVGDGKPEWQRWAEAHPVEGNDK